MLKKLLIYFLFTLKHIFLFALYPIPVVQTYRVIANTSNFVTKFSLRLEKITTFFLYSLRYMSFSGVFLPSSHLFHPVFYLRHFFLL